MWHTCDALSAEWEVALLGPSGCEHYASHVDLIETVPPAPLWRFLPSVVVQALRIARRFRPQLILSGSGLTMPAALLAGRAVRSPVVSWLHGLDIVAPSLVYQNIFVPTFRHCHTVIANSEHTAGLAVRAGVSSSSVTVLHPGVAIPRLATNTASQFRQRLSLGARPLLLSVGRLTPRKGLAEFVRICLPRVLASYPDALLMVVGDDATNAAHRHRHGGRASVIAAAQAGNVEGSIRFLGLLDDEKLSEAYAGSDLLVFPAIDIPGDVEGFGMVAIEAAAHGLPTVAFRVGGIPDAVADEGSGWLIEPGDYDAMAGTIVDWLIRREGTGVSRVGCTAHAARYSWDRFGADLRALIGRAGL